ncbi:CGGC domain-containing protein [Peptococcus simiae]|uniref:CGGC domain-containing protein n=1 Tax=Peptococcus simiae TaxID=1643805 RepID=A0ABW9GZU7_9FIRM
MKLGIIRCQQTENLCPGTKCLRGAQNHSFIFEEFKDEPIELVGMVSCGGCPGKQVGVRAADMIKWGADTIALASCITRGNPIGYACPFQAKQKELVRRQLGENGRLLEYTHE